MRNDNLAYLNAAAAAHSWALDANRKLESLPRETRDSLALIGATAADEGIRWECGHTDGFVCWDDKFPAPKWTVCGELTPAEQAALLAALDAATESD